MTTPAKASDRRSRTGASSLGTSNCPSRKRRPTGASSTISAAPGAKRTMSPLRTLSTSFTPAARASLACSERCRRLAVHGDGDARLHPGVHLLQLLAARMAGDVHQRVAVGDDLAAEIDEPVLDTADRALVAGDGARRKNDDVALVQLHLGMLVLGDARDGSTRLALAAGAQQNHFVRLQVGEMPLVVILEPGRQIARLHGHGDDAVHGAARHDDVAADGLGGFRNRFDARDVGGEYGHRDAPLRAPDDAGKRLGDVRLGGRAPLAQRIGGIADHRQHAVGAQLPEPRLVRRRPDRRRGVDLPVAGMQHGAETRCGWRRRWTPGSNGRPR